MEPENAPSQRRVLLNLLCNVTHRFTGCSCHFDVRSEVTRSFRSVSASIGIMSADVCFHVAARHCMGPTVTSWSVLPLASNFTELVPLLVINKFKGHLVVSWGAWHELSRLFTGLVHHILYLNKQLLCVRVRAHTPTSPHTP